MKATAQSRETYHPRIGENDTEKIVRRDSAARLRLIEQRIDFTGKTVLDLGCSGGFFALSIAKTARHVTAIDADLHMIERNRNEATRLGFKNVDFVHARIEPTTLSQLPSADIVLFLSVFHHILAASDNYEWNKVNYGDDISQLLIRIRGLANQHLAFEMGETWEPRANWATKIEAMIGDLPRWIQSNVFGTDFADVEAIPGPAYRQWPFRRWPKLARPACRTRVGRTFLHLTGIDRRDFRTIYIGRRAT